MSQYSVQDAYILEKVVDPNSAEFSHLFSLLMTNAAEVEMNKGNLLKKGEFRHTLPFRGEPEDESVVLDELPLKFPERGVFRNGITSLATTYAEMLDLYAICSSRRKTSNTMFVSAEADGVKDAIASSGAMSPIVVMVNPQDMLAGLLLYQPDTMVFDHTTIASPIDEVLNTAYKFGIRVVDGVFPYHVAGVRGWDVTAGFGKWSYTHTPGHVTICPDDDPIRAIKYTKDQYAKFVDPKRWKGNARKYGYELRKSHLGLVTYRAVFLGDAVEIPKESLVYDLPICSSEDMVLVTINRDLASGVFVSQSNNAQDLAKLDKNYAIEVRRDLFVTCVDFLMAKEKNSDIVGDAVRYIHQHNYVDLVDGVRIVRCQSLSYGDALCVAMVCALTAFALRFRLTNEALPDIRRHAASAKMLVDPAFGALSRLAWCMSSYISDAVNNATRRALQAAKHMLYSSDYIPGICFDVYTSMRYSPDLEWYDAPNLVLEGFDVGEGGRIEGPEGRGPLEGGPGPEDDPMVEFIAGSVKTSAPTALRESKAEQRAVRIIYDKYVPTPSDDPIAALQHVYDEAFPGNSVAQIQNAAELRKVKDIEFHTEFYGRLEIGKDIPIKEVLHDDAVIRTAALPVARTSLVDAILASAKRNFNPPDIQMQNDPWEYAKHLTDRFVETCFVPGYRSTLEKSYRRDPITFNLQDYMEWKATRDRGYMTALESECPADLVELNLEKYNTIIKRRVKPKLSVAAQYELSQPQVIVSLSKKDTAPFTSIFRKVFERFEAALRPEYASAGRMSDDQISQWLSDNTAVLLSSDCIEMDSSKYDKSQGLLARMLESLVMESLGLDPGVLELFGDSFVGKVSSMTLGLMFFLAYQMRSGGPDTMLGNVIYNFVSATESVGVSSIRAMIVKGDDNLLWVTKGTDAQGAVYRMGSLFNLESKLVTGEPWYFSSGYVVIADGRLWFVPDPLKIVELLGEKGQSVDTLPERYISFADRVSAYTRSSGIVDALVPLVRRRMRVPGLDVKMCVDNLLALALDRRLYYKVAR